MSNLALMRINYALNCVNRAKREIFIFSYRHLMPLNNFFSHFVLIRLWEIIRITIESSEKYMLIMKRRLYRITYTLDLNTMVTRDREKTVSPEVVPDCRS